MVHFWNPNSKCSPFFALYDLKSIICKVLTKMFNADNRSLKDQLNLNHFSEWSILKNCTYSQTTIYSVRSTSRRSSRCRLCFQFCQLSPLTPVFTHRKRQLLISKSISVVNFYVTDSYLVYFAVEFHHFCRFHEFMLKGAPHSLPVLSFPAKQQFQLPL